MQEYEVSWSMSYESDDPVDAVNQAWASLDDAVNRMTGTTVLVVRSISGEFVGAYDMSYDPPILLDEYTGLTK